MSRPGDPLEFSLVIAAHGFFARPQSTKGYEIVLAHRREPRCHTENAKLPPVRDTFSEGKGKEKGKEEESEPQSEQRCNSDFLSPLMAREVRNIGRREITRRAPGGDGRGPQSPVGRRVDSRRQDPERNSHLSSPFHPHSSRAHAMCTRSVHTILPLVAGRESVT